MEDEILLLESYFCLPGEFFAKEEIGINPTKYLLTYTFPASIASDNEVSIQLRLCIVDTADLKQNFSSENGARTFHFIRAPKLDVNIS